MCAAPALPAGAGGTDPFSDYHFSSFVALDLPITIIPRFTMAAVACVGGRYGPFEVNHPADVPLWLALYLRQTGTCTVLPPPYLSVERLAAALAQEEESDATFGTLPFYFYEVAHMLYGVGGGLAGAAGADAGGGGGSSTSAAAAEGERTEALRLVQEIQAARRRKLEQNMNVLEGDDAPMTVPAVKLSSIVSAELHLLRRTFAPVLTQARAMDARQTQPPAGVAPHAPIPPIHLRPGAGARGSAGALTTGRTSAFTDGSSTATPQRRSARSEASTGTTATTTTAAAGYGVAAGDGSLAYGDDGTATTGAPPTTPGGSQRDSTTGGGGGASTDDGATTVDSVDFARQPPPPPAAPPLKKRRTLRQT